MAISCTLNKDLLKKDKCMYILPEIKDIYIANYGDVSAATVDYDCESGVTVTGIQYTSTAITSFYHIEPQKNSVSFTDELVVEDNGNKYRTHTITFGLSKYDKDMVCPIDALALGRFIVVVETADEEYFMLGRTVGLEASAQSIAGGADTNGITVTLSANVTESIVPLAEAAINAVKGS